MPRAQGCAGVVLVQDVLYAAGAGMRRSGACTGRTICRGRRDAQERCLYRMYHMPRVQGRTRAANVQEVGIPRALECAVTAELINRW